MAVEDLTTYTLSSAGGTISVSSTRATATAYQARGSVAGYLQKDKGAAHFTGDFSHKVDSNFTTLASLGITAAWYLSDTPGDYKTIADANGSLVIVFINDTASVVLRDLRGGVNTDDSFSGTTDTALYFTISRSGTTVTCTIYSDSGRTTVVDTLSITPGSATAFRYVGLVTNYADNNNSNTVTGYFENLDLQEGGGGGQTLHPMSLL